jgi:hypothetical protein
MNGQNQCGADGEWRSRREPLVVRAVRGEQIEVQNRKPILHACTKNTVKSLATTGTLAYFTGHLMPVTTKRAL